MVLTREEKEGLVSDLYNQGKNTRQIAQQVGISFRDIGAILQKAAKEKEREHSISVSSQAYAMFSEGKTPIQVAIKLNLREAEVTKFYTEFWNLNDLEALSKVYHEINGNIQYFLELYRLTKKANMNLQNIMTTLKIANNDLPTLEANYWTLQEAVSNLEAEKHRSAIVIQELNDHIWGLQNTRDSLQSDCREMSLEITKLRIQKIRLEDAINEIQNDRVIHSKIKEIVKRQFEGFLSDRQMIFRLTFEPLIKSMRKDPIIIPDSYQKATHYPVELPDHIPNKDQVTEGDSDIDSDH
jgi:chromosome segregation ATPase